MSSTKPVVTIGFPAYNEEEYVLPCLRGLASLNTTTTPIQFIAANNASTDRTGQILEACGITVVDEAQKGTSYARQALVEAAAGEFLMQTDADTQVPPTWVEAHLKHYDKSNLIGVGGNIKSPNSHILWKIYTRANWTTHKVLNCIHRYPSPPSISGANFSARTQSIKDVGGYEPGFNKGEDNLMARRLSENGLVVFDNSQPITVISDGRRMKTLEQVINHFNKRFKEKSFWLNMLYGRKNIKPEDFEDIR